MNYIRPKKNCSIIRAGIVQEGDFVKYNQGNWESADSLIGEYAEALRENGWAICRPSKM